MSRITGCEDGGLVQAPDVIQYQIRIGTSLLDSIHPFGHQPNLSGSGIHSPGSTTAWALRAFASYDILVMPYADPENSQPDQLSAVDLAVLLAGPIF